MPKSTVTPIRGRPAALGTSALELKQMAGRRSIRTIEIAGSIRCDLDTAALALERAAGILDVLALACDTAVEARELKRAIYAANSEVERADDALFGEVQPPSSPCCWQAAPR